MRDARRRVLSLLAVTALALALGGCMQLETTIRLEQDGSAVITERLRITGKLLDLESDAGAEKIFTRLLEKGGAEARVAQMGEGATLESHKVQDAEGGSRESVSVYRIADINKLQYVSPFLNTMEYDKHNRITFQLFPIYQSTWYGRHAGQMAVAVKLTTTPPRPPQRKEGEPPPPGPSPANLQIYRDLKPIFQDMMKDFRVKLTFESYAPLRFRQYYRYRGMGAGTRTFDLIDFSSSNLDNFGGNFLDNEEVMLELLRGEMGGHNIVEHVKESGTNTTLPVFHTGGVPEIYFRPSRPLFDKNFTGKELIFDEKKEQKRNAEWEKDGYKEKPNP